TTTRSAPRAGRRTARGSAPPGEGSEARPVMRRARPPAARAPAHRSCPGPFHRMRGDVRAELHAIEVDLRDPPVRTVPGFGDRAALPGHGQDATAGGPELPVTVPPGPGVEDGHPFMRERILDTGDRYTGRIAPRISL